MEKELYIHEDGERAVLLTNDRDMKLKNVTSLLQGDIPELKRARTRLDYLRDKYQGNSKEARELENRLLETDAHFRVRRLGDFTPNTDENVVRPYADTKDDLSVSDFCTQNGLAFLGTLEGEKASGAMTSLSTLQDLGFLKGVELKHLRMYQPGPNTFVAYNPSEINIPIKPKRTDSPEKEPDIKSDGQKHYFRKTGQNWVEVPKDKILGADAVPRHMRREGHGYNVVVDDRVKGKNTVHVYEDGRFVCSMDLAQKYKIRSSEKGYSDFLRGRRTGKASSGPISPRSWSGPKKNIKYREKGR